MYYSQNMLEIILLIAVIFLAAKFHKLRDEIAEIKQRLDGTVPSPQEKPLVSVVRPPIEPVKQDPAKMAQPVLARTTHPAPVESVTQTQTNYFEKIFSLQYSIWIGAVALAMSGFYLAQYSIQNGLLSPTMRLFLGLIMGVVMILAGNWVHEHPTIANAKRISQGLAGAGVAALYACLFAASSSMYSLLPDYVTLFCLIILTLTCVVMALKIGMPIAILGMVGGFLVPAFLSTQAVNVPLFSLYVYCICASLLFAARSRGWWLLALIAVLLGISWIGYLMIFVAVATLASVASMNIAALFLLALMATAVWSVQGIVESVGRIPLFLIHFVVSLPLVIFGVLQTYLVFNFIQWSFIALFALASLMLAYFDQKKYAYAPFITLAVLFVLLFNSSMLSPGLFAMVITGFAVTYAVFGFAAMWRAINPAHFAILSCVSSVGFYCIAYWNLNYQAEKIIPGTFCYIAVFYAILYLGALWEVLQRWPKKHPQQELLLAIYCSTVTAFIALAIAIQVPGKFLPVAFSLQFAAMTWVYSQLRIKVMDWLVLTVGAIPIYLVGMQIINLIYSLTIMMLSNTQNSLIVQYPLVQLGLPGLCFLIGGALLNKAEKTEWGDFFMRAALIGFAFLVYILVRESQHTQQFFGTVAADMYERALVNHALILLALLYLAIVRLRPNLLVFRDVSEALFAFVLIVIFVIDVVLRNPVMTGEYVGQHPIVNLLTFALLTPWLLYYLGQFVMQYKEPKPLQSLYHVLELILVFAWLTLSIRQFFIGPTLQFAMQQPMSHMEIISYSIGWIVFGLGLVFAGALKRSKELRIAGLLIMMLSIAKVFLFDASSLQGLMRVMSFLGLGISLIGIGWFSARFVIPEEGTDKK